MITRDDDGYVALRYYQNNPKYFSRKGREYVVSVQFNTALLYVHPDDVDSFLNLEGGCCGQKVKRVFWLANENDISIFNTGHLP